MNTLPSYLIINPNTTALVTERLKGLAGKLLAPATVQAVTAPFALLGQLLGDVG